MIRQRYRHFVAYFRHPVYYTKMQLLRSYGAERKAMQLFFCNLLKNIPLIPLVALD